MSHVDNGSSPLTRGKPSVREICQACFRLIPAHAGKTTVRRARFPPRTAHPRSHGENEEFASCLDEVTGSSPLTRGKLAPAGSPRPKRRLIPAHAGKTAAVISPPTSWSAHPRSRGENFPLKSRFFCLAGSSPLTRGKHNKGAITRAFLRLIPAHAGKTHWLFRLPIHIEAHPRSRGENSAP